MRVRLGVEVRGDDLVARRLDRLATNAVDGNRFFRRAAAILMRGSRERWQSGKGWRKLDKATLRMKAKRGQSPKPLRATERLERALTVWKAPGQRLDIRPDELVFGLKRQGVAYYGAFHQMGEGVPRRRVLGVTRTTRERLKVALLHHLLKE